MDSVDRPAHRCYVAESKAPARFLTIIQLIGGILTAWVVMFCPAIWAAAAFRSDIDPNLVRTLNDLGFFLFNITYAVTSVQAIAAGLVGPLADKSARPVFPRWVSGWAIFGASALSRSPRHAILWSETRVQWRI